MIHFMYPTGLYPYKIVYIHKTGERYRLKSERVSIYPGRLHNEKMDPYRADHSCMSQLYNTNTRTTPNWRYNAFIRAPSDRWQILWQ
ncbi:MAG: hypothetical protein ACI8V2_005139 [Candidatus Latescibacterota bacterium]|jgi:hypothetical protein